MGNWLRKQSIGHFDKLPYILTSRLCWSSVQYSTYILFSYILHSTFYSSSMEYFRSSQPILDANMCSWPKCGVKQPDKSKIGRVRRSPVRPVAIPVPFVSSFARAKWWCRWLVAFYSPSPRDGFHMAKYRRIAWKKGHNRWPKLMGLNGRGWFLDALTYSTVVRDGWPRLGLIPIKLDLGTKRVGSGPPDQDIILLLRQAQQCSDCHGYCLQSRCNLPYPFFIFHYIQYSWGHHNTSTSISTSTRTVNISSSPFLFF